jgi:hypothetical protein
MNLKMLRKRLLLFRFHSPQAYNNFLDTPTITRGLGQDCGSSIAGPARWMEKGPLPLPHRQLR